MDIVRRTLLAAGLGTLLAPSAACAAARDANAFAEDMISAGFLSGLDAGQAKAIEADLRKYDWGGVFDHPWRAIFADDEDIAEGGADVFLNDANRALTRLGVPPLVGETEFGDGFYHWKVAGETVVLYGPREVEHSWGLASGRLQRRLNRHLAEHGRDDRFYSVYGGNGGRSLVFNPAMMTAIARLRLPLSERPYERTDKPPTFGAPG